MTGETRAYWTGLEAFDACNQRWTAARDEVRDMAHQAAQRIADTDEASAKAIALCVRGALVDAMGHFDEEMRGLAAVFGVEAPGGPDRPALAEDPVEERPDPSLGLRPTARIFRPQTPKPIVDADPPAEPVADPRRHDRTRKLSARQLRPPARHRAAS